VVLVGGDLRRLAYAVALAPYSVSVIQQNVVISLVTRAFLLLGTFGVVGLAVAVLADMERRSWLQPMGCVCLEQNYLRLKRCRSQLARCSHTATRITIIL